MRRFIITNESKFSGSAEIWYNDRGTLCKIDATQTNMNQEVIRDLKAAIPSTLENLINGKAFGAMTTIVEADLDISFEKFWEDYRKKINKLRCEALWNKLNKVQQVSAYYGISKYDKFLHNENWRTKADPETYLRNQMWQNEWK